MRAEGDVVVLCRAKPVDTHSGLCVTHHERIVGPRRDASMEQMYRSA